MLKKPLAVGLIIGLFTGLGLGIYLTDINPTKEHYSLYKEIYGIKNRMIIKITERARKPRTNMRMV